MTSDFRVGSWTVRPSLNTLSENGTTARIEPKIMQVLVCLASQPGIAVTKEEFFERVWPDTFVSEDVLIRSISELRRVFKDDARHPNFIETIPKRGYRLMASVTPVNGHNDIIKAAAIEPSKPSKTNKRFAWFTIAAMVLACGVLVGFNISDVRAHVFRSKPSIRSLAVLPLKNLSDDPSQRYFASGMTEQLITDLSQISALKVISRTSSEVYENTHKTLPEIARELNVDAMVEGSVERSGNRVRVTAQLIHAPEDKNLWARSYEANLQDALTVQKTLARAIADEIRVRVSPNEQARLRTARPINANALNYYLQGNYYLHRTAHGSVDDQAQKAAQDFQRAIDIDPDFALAYVGLANAHGGRSDTEALMNPSLQDYGVAKAAIEKALELDPDSSEAHDFMAFIDYAEWNWSQAEEELKRAIALNPNLAEAHDDFAWFLLGMGRQEEGIRETQLAQALDPNGDHLSGALTSVGRLEEDRQLFLRDIEREPDDGRSHYNLFMIYTMQGNHTDAIKHLQAAAQSFGFSELVHPLERTFREHGFEPALRLVCRRLEELERANKIYIPGILAEFYSLLRDKDRAFYWLEDEAQHKPLIGMDGGLVWLKGDPAYAPLRSDPRYKQLLQRVGLPSD